MDEERCCGTCEHWKHIDQIRRCAKLILTGNTYSVMLTESTDQFVGEHPRTLPAFCCVYWEGVPQSFIVELMPLSKNRIRVNVFTRYGLEPENLGTYNNGYTLGSILKILQERE